MSLSVVTAALDREIIVLEGKLAALRTARRALAATGVPKRRRLTDAEKALISRRMKAAWKKRKAAKPAT